MTCTLSCVYTHTLDETHFLVNFLVPGRISPDPPSNFFLYIYFSMTFYIYIYIYIYSNINKKSKKK